MKLCRNFFLLIMVAVFFSGCVRAVPKSVFYPVSASNMEFADDLDSASLELAIQHSIHYYEKVGRNKIYRVAEKEISAQQLKETLTAFLTILQRAENASEFNRKIAAEFDVYRIAGKD